MATLNKDGSVRANSTKGKVSVSLRLDAQTKRYIDIMAWLRRASFSNLVEKAAMEYLVNHPFTKAEGELIKTVLEEHSKARAKNPEAFNNVIRNAVTQDPLGFSEEDVLKLIFQFKPNSAQAKAAKARVEKIKSLQNKTKKKA